MIKLYFINFSNCSVCKQKKSVAINKKTLNRKICIDCDKDYYESVAIAQKEYWISGNRKS